MAPRQDALLCVAKLMIILGIANFRRDAQSKILNLWVTAQRGYYTLVCNSIDIYSHLYYYIDQAEHTYLMEGVAHCRIDGGNTHYIC
jgi:hypothetical protein